MTTHKILARTCILSLLSTTIFLFLVSVACAQTVSVKNDNVNVRTGPSKNYPVTFEVPKGYPLKVIKRKGNWLKVTDFEKDTGWIYKPLVEKRKTVIVDAKNMANMRAEPKKKKGNVVGHIDRGTMFTVLRSKGDWVKLRHDNGKEKLVGWIHKNLLWPRS